MLLSILLTIHIIVCIALIGVILLQRSEGGAFGMGGGGAGNFMTARGAGDLLTRTTAILATLFFVLSLTLTLLSGRNHADKSLIDRMNIEKLDLKNQPIAPTPSVPAAPPAGGPQAPVPEIGGAAPQSGPADPLAGLTSDPSLPAKR